MGLIADTPTIIKAAGIPLSRGIDDPRPPEISVTKGIRFNEAGDNARENFVLSEETQENITKTNRRPYDRVVCGVLLRAYMLAPRQFRVSGDGMWDDEMEWVPVRKLYHDLWPDEEINSPLEY
ncbi:uncharacterized protein TRUGW13939_05011 [Talaromyces rugulosus]|uniref:Uncharacterized protein n=1 Tax=Talaromyces rugulosus TaxID=121627 RepID=A0A7H8QWR4_TALRU|nr:uncharacterized protein TRUGW13939_05011 [Talaromyces rugulosus]QKX57891.1 hypothetical protein TRUGW13939_05011 [Talaromyces rugulosus]